MPETSRANFRRWSQNALSNLHFKYLLIHIRLAYWLATQRLFLSQQTTIFQASVRALSCSSFSNCLFSSNRNLTCAPVVLVFVDLTVAFLLSLKLPPYISLAYCLSWSEMKGLLGVEACMAGRCPRSANWKQYNESRCYKSMTCKHLWILVLALVYLASWTHIVIYTVPRSGLRSGA